MKYLIALFLVCLTITHAQAFEFKETSKKDMNLSARAIFLHSGPGEKRASVGVCRSGYLQLKANNGDELFEFLSPCIMGGVKLKGSENPNAQLGIGLFEVMNLLSGNLVIDSRKGEIFWGLGFSMDVSDFGIE